MNIKEANKHFPLWKIELGEYVYGRDSGSPWSDPENDIRKSGSINYYSKESVDSEWIKEYSEGLGEFNYGLHNAAITLSRLKEHHGMYPTEDHVMFEYNDKMFRLTNWIDYQKCVCGEAIDEFYNDYEEDSSVKVDVIKSIVFYYKRDTLVMQGGRFYLNGKMVGTKEAIKRNCNIEYHQAEMMYPDNVKETFRKLFPQAKYYKSWQASGSLK